ncbi:MAG: HD domain-containing protein [Patescibacteria group bacterium]|jgi:HD superfamily phosphodiesterase|nr:HD domain-containing protein [Patescibacteria group bacterium]
MDKKYKHIKNKIEKLVKDACFSPNNVYTNTVWAHHIQPVVSHSLFLGRKMGADLEVIELAALLHDYSAIVNIKLEKEHHIHSAKMAREILENEHFDQKKIKMIEVSIISHRGSIVMSKNSLEAQILASADAMSHITELADMFYLAYGVHAYKTEEGAKWLLAKLERSWNKIMPEGQKIVIEDYKIAVKLLKKVIV